MARARRALAGLAGLRRRRRLLAAAGTGLAAVAVLRTATPLTGIEAALCGWNLAVATYLGLIAQLFLSADVAGIRRRAAREDEGAVALLLFSVGATVASLVAIVALLAGGAAGGGAGGAGSDGGGAAGWHVALAAATILTAWGFLHTVFAVHYAHEYYAAPPEPGEAAEAGGLDFPGTPEPDYLDFLYFSVVVGATAQTADVSTTSRRIRRITLAHGVLSFFFNTTILALLVNIGAGLL